MKKLMTFVVTMLLVIQASAQQQSEVLSPKQPDVQWIHYLSDVEKEDMARKLALEEVNRLEATGELYEMLEKGDEGTQERTISFPASFKKSTSAAIDARSANAASGGSGNVSCTINVQSPHAGFFSGVRVVKAKSDGSCNYVHVAGEMPPTISWNLVMVLVRHGVAPGPSTISSANYLRTGLNVFWGATIAQVADSGCNNGTYSHSDYVTVTPPPGWIYSGPQPIPIGIKAKEVSNC